ncbi:MAG: SAM-dependent methyltransferase [Actinomycetota bacterium]
MRLSSSFRDPHGFMFERDGILYRHVAEEHREHLTRLTESGLCERLFADGLLIPHVEADPALSPGAAAVLMPERVGFVSYPYEWSYSQLRDAALATLRIQALALEHGMSLRDATAYNVTFHRGLPTFLDTTSLEILPENRPWVAYRQFCQHFLAPLALMAYRDVRLGQLSRIHLDGVPLDLASGLLPARTAAKLGIAMHLRMHARSQRRHEKDAVWPDGPTPRGFSIKAFHGLIASLRRAVEALPEPAGASVWRAYYSESDHYTTEALGAKQQLVNGWIARCSPATVWDLGANTGRFAHLASQRGIATTAFDLDPFCVEESYREARSAGIESFLPLVMDLTNPSPGLGWANVERHTLQARGPADLVLALALVHHLSIGNNVPLPMVMEDLARLGRAAIVEFIPKDDPKVVQLLHGREDVFGGYTQDGFERAARSYFDLATREDLPGSGRALYLLERRSVRD